MHGHQALGYFFLTKLKSNLHNPTMTVTTILQGGLYRMGCMNTVSSVHVCMAAADSAVVLLELDD